MKTAVAIVFIIFLNVVNGISYEVIENSTNDVRENQNIQNVINQLENVAGNFSQRETYTNIQRSGLITGTVPSDPIEMGVYLVEIFWQGLTPIIINQDVVETTAEQGLVVILQLSQGVFYAITLLILYQLLHNKKSD